MKYGLGILGAISLLICLGIFADQFTENKIVAVMFGISGSVFITGAFITIAIDRLNRA